MRCGKPEHQLGQKCAAKNAKCKDCHKIGHFYKVCQSKKKTRRANLAQIGHQTEQDTYYNPQAKQDTYFNDFTGYGLSDSNPPNQPNPPMVNMLKIVNHIGVTSGSQEKHLKFPIDVDPRGPYKHHLVVRVGTGDDVNCMNEKTFKKLFAEVKLFVCPHEIQNFGNLIADISILGQFHTYLQFRGEKYLNTFIVTNANDCPNLLSHGATFRMGVLLPNYPEENVVKSACGENVPNFKYGTSTGTSSNVFQILQDLRLKQYQENYPDSLQSESRKSRTSTTNTTSTTAQPTPFSTYGSTTANEKTGTLIHNTSMSQSSTSFRTTTPTRDMTGRTNTFRTTPNTRPHITQDTSCSRLSQCCMHVHQTCKSGL